MIASECGISRTLLYKYFKDKRAIFNEAIDEATSSIAETYRELRRSRQTTDAKMRQLCTAVFALLYDNRDFLCVIIDFLRDRQRTGRLPVEQIMRHTVGLKRIVHSFLVEARHRGEYLQDLDVNRATMLIYSQFEAAILRIGISGDAEISESISSMNAILMSFHK